MYILAKARLLRYRDMANYLESDIKSLRKEGKQGNEVVRELERVHKTLLEVLEKFNNPEKGYSQRLLVEKIR